MDAKLKAMGMAYVSLLPGERHARVGGGIYPLTDQQFAFRTRDVEIDGRRVCAIPLEELS